MIAERVQGSAISGARAPDVLAMDVPVGHDAVRVALQGWRRWIEGVNACSDLVSRAEIVLAEVPNNITEHGFAEQEGVLLPIAVHCRMSGRRLHVMVVDKGRPVPADRCLAAVLPPVSLGTQDMDGLPEGGFGWCLIRELTCDLSLVSDGSGNRLCFVVPLGKPGSLADPAAPATPARPA